MSPEMIVKRKENVATIKMRYVPRSISEYKQNDCCRADGTWQGSIVKQDRMFLGSFCPFNIPFLGDTSLGSSFFYGNFFVIIMVRVGSIGEITPKFHHKHMCQKSDLSRFHAGSYDLF